jgi:hypothetical protein
MKPSSSAPDSTYTAQARTLGIAAAWIGFAVNEVYALVSGAAFASQGAAVESGPFLSIMALLVVVMGPFLVLAMIAVHAYASPERKPYSLAALAFMLACVTVTSCINFLLLMVSSQPALFQEPFRALFLPCRWPVPAFVLDNFVWDWFFGVSMLLAAPVFSGSRLKISLRPAAPVLSGNRLRAALPLAMILSGALCLAGLAWIAVSPAQAVIIGILGWGAAGPIVFLLLANLFSRVQPVTREIPAP